MDSAAPPREALGTENDGPDHDQKTVGHTSDLMPVKTASALAGVADETIRAWYDSGEVTGVRTERGHRLISSDSLLRRMRSIGVGEASRIVNRPPHIVRAWFDLGYIDGYRTAAGRRRLDGASVRKYAQECDQ